MNSPKHSTNAPQSRTDKFFRSLAGKLNRSVNPLSTPAKKVALLTFGILMGGASLLLIINSFQNEPKADLAQDAITIPIDIYESLSRQSKEDTEILKLKNLLDSMKHDPERRHIFDSLVKHRPGLIDSINLYLNLTRRKRTD